MSGVYLVQIDPDISGPDNVVWAYHDEADAEMLRDLINEAERSEWRQDDAAWVTFEPVSHSITDPDSHDMLAIRLGEDWRNIVKKKLGLADAS